ncbi:subtilisin-like protein [Mytilinidion resinicola]|uniref:Subtilisin-like protein n=1 Tax=Mytilinidion resinicola TaxID=574789 RepID=A0A6A6Z3P2_9PEZI|nr:subtilisin-like protein [Mytilinidion resinicola]KAF2815771.1 subtilisin-like protein [Mytilinidion resinicola]
MRMSATDHLRAEIEITRPSSAMGHKVNGRLLDWPCPQPRPQVADGHGTHAVGLLLKVCPLADVYVYRVTENDTHSTNREHVAEALEDAIGKVDIISISFGWDLDNNQRLRDLLQRAYREGVLVFAASSNEGTRGSIAYPARSDEVIAVDSADYHGEPSKYNTPEDDQKLRFTALGEDVESAYPPQRARAGVTPGSKRLSGTSCATPIAAATAAMLLEFAKQPPLGFDPSVLQHLKMVKSSETSWGKRSMLTYLPSLGLANNDQEELGYGYQVLNSGQG